MSEIIMMMGLPNSGKSAYVKEHYPTFSVVDTDSYIENKAKELNSTYSDVFKQYIRESTINMFKQVDQISKELKSFVWDQTNLTINTRLNKLLMINNLEKYKVTLVYVHCPISVILERNKNRIGKVIPEDIIFDMANKLEEYDPNRERNINFVSYASHDYEIRS